MTAEERAPTASTRVEESANPCRRCGQTRWRVETRPKGRLRWLLEAMVALPDVVIFQSESGGWPGKETEYWTCLNCGRRVRL
ncbi:MAG: hypothetical protein HYS09_06985 [Chloroflexi bacterium]|nr:hypothetical protein [Chloroflexota bacterium]